MSVSQGKVTGVIIPPPDIRAVVDKTAMFVGKNGKSFEQRILDSGEGKTAKFNFMKQFDPYHAYYEMKIKEVEDAIANGESLASLAAPKPKPVEETKAPEAPQPVISQPVATAQKASLLNPIAKILQTKSIDPPRPFEFTIHTPTGLTAEDIDIIKLTAQYTAANGREFLAGIATREQRNPQFDFLKPTHMLFSYFTTLVDCYMKIINPSAEMMGHLQKMTVFDNVLESSVRRWDYTRTEERRKKTESAEQDEERLAFQQIDWFDFVVVETIDFPESELFEIPGMTSLGLAPQPAIVDVNITPTYTPAQPPKPPSAPPAPPVAPRGFAPPPPPPSLSVHAPAAPEEQDDPDMKIVSNYQPRLAGVAGVGQKQNLTMYDNTGKLIPIDKIDEHMRVQLLDPKWREEQKRFLDKQKETGYAEGSSIADSLSNFARKRGDIFGQAAAGSGPNSAAAIAETEAVEQQRYEDSVQWDGHYGSINTAQEQKANQTMSFAQRGLLPQPPTNLPPAIGPSTTAPVPMQPQSFAYPTPAPPTGNNGGAPAPTIASALQAYELSMSAQTAATLAPVLPVVPVLPVPLPLVPLAPGLVAPAFPFALAPGQLPPPPAYGVPQPFAPPPALYGEQQQREEPNAKKMKPSDNLMSESEFAEMYPTVSLSITTPVDSSPQGVAWNLSGQTIHLANLSSRMTVKDIKELLATQYLGGLQASKQQIKSAELGFLKDPSTIAALNLHNNTQLELSLKSRGGKK